MWLDLTGVRVACLGAATPLRRASDFLGRSGETGLGARFGADVFAFTFATGFFATVFFDGRLRDVDLREGFDFRGAMAVSVSVSGGTLKNRTASGKAHGRHGMPLLGRGEAGAAQ